MILPSVRPLNQALANNWLHSSISIFVQIYNKMLYTSTFPVIPTSALIPSPMFPVIPTSAFILPNVPFNYTHFNLYIPQCSLSLYPLQLLCPPMFPLQPLYHPNVPFHYTHFSHYTPPPMFPFVIPTSAFISPNVSFHYTHFSLYIPPPMFPVILPTSLIPPPQFCHIVYTPNPLIHQHCST